MYFLRSTLSPIAVIFESRESSEFDFRLPTNLSVPVQLFKTAKRLVVEALHCQCCLECESKVDSVPDDRARGVDVAATTRVDRALRSILLVRYCLDCVLCCHVDVRLALITAYRTARHVVEHQ